MEKILQTYTFLLRGTWKLNWGGLALSEREVKLLQFVCTYYKVRACMYMDSYCGVVDVQQPLSPLADCVHIVKKPVMQDLGWFYML